MDISEEKWKEKGIIVRHANAVSPQIAKHGQDTSYVFGSADQVQEIPFSNRLKYEQSKQIAASQTVNQIHA